MEIATRRTQRHAKRQTSTTSAAPLSMFVKAKLESVFKLLSVFPASVELESVNRPIALQINLVGCAPQAAHPAYASTGAARATLFCRYGYGLL